MPQKCSMCGHAAAFKCYCSAEAYYCGEDCAQMDSEHQKDAAHISWHIDHKVQLQSDKTEKRATDSDSHDVDMKDILLVDADTLIEAHRMKMRSKKKLRMQLLMHNHVDYTHKVIVAVLRGLPRDDFNAYVARLMKNQENIGDLIGEITKNQSVANTVTRLLQDHIRGAAAILMALRDGDELDVLIEEWRENGRQISAALAGLSRRLTYEALNNAFQLHLTQTIEEAVDVQRGDMAAAIEKLDIARDHMIVVGMVLVKGLKKFRM